jgi:hypothetical protein
MTNNEVIEILKHTPSEHSIIGKRYPIIVQIIHIAIKGVMRYKAVL